MSRWLVLCCLFILSAAARSQTPAPLAQPDLDLWSAGSVSAMVPTADGGRIIGGAFTHVGGLPRQNLARLLPDGTVDPAWSADVDGSVTALAVDAAGRTYLAGSFTQVAGLARQRLARLLPNGQPDSWEPAPLDFGFPASVNDVLVVGNQVYVAGRFTIIAGQARAGLARFDASSGALDGSWSPPASFGSVTALASDGQFLYVNAGPNVADRLLRYPLTGAAVFDPDWQPEVSGNTFALVADGSGALYIAGGFSLVQGSSRNGLARLSTAVGAALDPAWQPQVDGSIQSLLLAPSGLYVGGRIRSVGGLPRANLARVELTGSGAVDAGFAPATLGGIVLTLSGAAGVVHVGGEFDSVDGLPASALTSLSTTSGAPQAGPGAERASGSVHAILPLPDGGLLVGGRFTRVGALPRMNLVRLTPQGLPDPDWRVDFNGQPVPYRQSPGESGGFDFAPGVRVLARDTSGRVYVGGAFSHAGGSLQRANVARLLADGQVDVSWNPGTDGLVSAIAVDGANGVFLGGNFLQVAGQVRGNLAKLGDGPGAVLDRNWQANLDSGAWVADLELDGAGALFAGGSGFQSVNGEICCLNLVKLATSGSGACDPLWNLRPTGSQGRVIDLQVDELGRLYIAGRFDGLNQGGNQLTINSLARVSAAGVGAVDATWTPIASTSIFVGVVSISLGSEDRVYAAAFDSSSDQVAAWSTLGSGAQIAGWQMEVDTSVSALIVAAGRLSVGGEFSTIGGAPRRGLAVFATEGLFRGSFE